MNKHIWMGALFASLGAWAIRAGAQEAPWGPARPGEWAPPACVAQTPGATLGRPVAVSSDAPRIDAGVVTASYREPAAPTPVPRYGPDAIDGPDATEDGLFASDRAVRPASFSAEPITVQPRPGPAAADAAVAPGFNPFPVADAPMPEEAGGLFPGLDSWAPRFYARGEYLLWRFKRDQVPPLVTTSAPADNGFLTGKTTQVLFGGDGLGSGTHSGGRFTAGLWLDDCQTKAIEISGFFLPGDEQRFDANSALFPVIARPFFSLNRNQEFAQLTAFPGESTGNIAVRNNSDLWGVEANYRCNLCCGCTECDDSCCGGGLAYHIDGLAGFRYLNLHEDLSITENLVNLATAPAGRGNLAALVFDDFATRNQFYGGQVGLEAELGRGPWSLNVLGKVALGDTNQRIDVNGGQRVTSLATGVTTPFVGGLLALPSNIGSHTRNEFSVVPEVNLTLSYHVNEHWRVFAGYDFLYWTNVVRPGQQIDRVLDETLIPNFDTPGTVAPAGQNRPAVPFRQSDFWAQGLNLGLEFRY